MDFHHPYEPYDIQRDFMNAVYQCLEEGKVGIFESPTGTGKTLSLICGSLTWLRNHKRKLFDENLANLGRDDDEPVWMVEHEKSERRRAILDRRQELEKRLAKIRAKEEQQKQRYQNGEPAAKYRKLDHDKSPSKLDDESHFLLDDYDSDNEQRQRLQTQSTNELGLSAETLAMLKELRDGESRKDTDEVELEDELKVFFCSRTHSQLIQFAGELRKVDLPPGLPPEPLEQSDAEDSLERNIVEHVKHLTLGSRKNLCINPKVSRLGNSTAINERCLELQEAKTPADRRCPYRPTKETEVLVNEFRDYALAKVRDIEDFGVLGKKIGVCPYYASRETVKRSEVVTLPYPLLLQRSSREALGLSLKDHIVIIDEAHNLMDAIAGMYSASVTLCQLKLARSKLMIYLQKFRNRLKGKNRVYVTQTVRLVDSIIAFLDKFSASKAGEEVLVNVSDLMAGNGVDQINLYKLAQYLQESKLARKVDGYIDHVEEEQRAQQNNGIAKPRSIPVLMLIQGFLLTLMNPSAEGRFFCNSTLAKDDVELRYMLLDPTYHFKDIVDEARAVVLAGGTMSPVRGCSILD